MVSFDAVQGSHERLVATVGSRDTAICGLAPQPHYSVAKWCWIAEQMPEVYRRAATLACFGELVAVRLGLPPVIDHTMAARTLAFDVAAERWSPEILEAAGIDRDKLPAPAPSGTPIGAVAPGRARDLGLADGAVLVAGAFDQVCAGYARHRRRGRDGELSLGRCRAAGGRCRCGRPAGTTRSPAATRLAGVVGAARGGDAVRPCRTWCRDRLAIAGSPPVVQSALVPDQIGAAGREPRTPNEGAFSADPRR